MPAKLGNRVENDNDLTNGHTKIRHKKGLKSPTSHPQKGVKCLPQVTTSIHSPKRHSSVHYSDNLKGVTKPAIQRLARRGGVKRIGRNMYDETRKILKEFLKDVLHKAICHTQHAKRQTVTVPDIVNGLRTSNYKIQFYV